MLKIGPHPIDRAIWGASDDAGTQTPPKKIEEDSGRIDLTELIAEAQVEVASKTERTQSAAPASEAHPLLIFPFGPPSAPAPAPPVPPVPPVDVVPRFRKVRLRSLVMPGALIIIGAVLAVMAVGSEPEPMPVASAASAILPTTPAPPPPPSAKETSAEEAKPEAARPTAAPSSAPPVRRRPATRGTATAQPARPADPCKGDLICAMKRATERR